MTLIACALVATRWTESSQRRLLSSVLIRKHNYQQWMSSVVLSRSRVRLLGYVRSLRIGHNRDISIEFRNLIQDHGEYLSALHNVHSLTIVNTRVESIPQDQFHTCFSAFRGTLTYISLKAFATSFSAFMALVDYFPNIRPLQLCLLVVYLTRDQFLRCHDRSEGNYAYIPAFEPIYRSSSIASPSWTWSTRSWRLGLRPHRRILGFWRPPSE